MELNNKKVFITGGAGFIGANLVRSLLANKNHIHLVLKSTTNTWRLKDILSKIQTHQVTLADSEGLTKLFSQIRPDYIFHLSAHGSYPAQKDVAQMIDTNIVGTHAMLAASQEVDYAGFVSVGSSSEYGYKDSPMKESDLLEPASFYAATKASQTLLCQVWAKTHTKPIVTVRPFSVYGPYEEKGRFIPTIITNLLSNKPIHLADPQIVRDFIYVDDFVSAMCSAALMAKDNAGLIFNAGSGTQTTLIDAVETLFDVAKRKVEVKVGTYEKRSWDTKNWVADISMAERLLKWKTKYSLKEGFSESLNWFEKNLDFYTGENHG